MTFRPRLETLESRACPTAVCTANPVYTAECNYLDNLITPQQATLTAVQSGNWSDPATWGGRTPTSQDVVYIPAGDTVTVDTTGCQALAVANNGTLTWLPTADTSLTVDTVTSGMDYAQEGVPQGEIDIGTQANPIQAGYTADLIFQRAPAAARNALFEGGNDYDSLSGGLISMGTLNVYGSEVTPYVGVSGSLAAGSTTIQLADGPAGWQAGDTLLIPGTTTSGANQDEQLPVVGVSGNTVTLAGPLRYAHAAAPGTQFLVADETRNVVVESAPGTPADQQGCVMQMHNDVAGIAYADFLNLGRTDKSEPLNNGSPTTGPGANQVGRYALHFHRCDYPGLTDNDPPIPVVGCFESGSPGWGYVNHSSDVAFAGDVAFDNFGAGFVTEAGNEIGSFSGDYAVRSVGLPNTATTLGIFDPNDFGKEGEGFWMQSPNVSLTDDAATDCQVGYAFWQQPLVEKGLGAAQVYIPWTANPGAYVQSAGAGQSQTYKGDTVDPGFVPVRDFSGDTASFATVGFSDNWNLQFQTTQRSVVNDFTASDVTADGVLENAFSQNLTVQNSTIVSAPGGNGTGLNMGGPYGKTINVTGDTVEGFAVGLTLPVSATTNVVTGGYWDDTTAFVIPQNVVGGRILDFTGNIQFGPDVQTEYFLKPPSESSQSLLGFLGPSQTFLPDGSELYFADQLPGAVPLPTPQSYLPPALVGLTSGQLESQYGLAPQGELAPASAVAESWTNGYDGPAETEPAYYSLASVWSAPHAAPYTLRYTKLANGVTTTTTVSVPYSLQAGWNMIVLNLSGQRVTFFVFGA